MSHRNIVEGLEPHSNPKEWVSPEIPYTSEQIDGHFPGRPFNIPTCAWFRQETGQRRSFGFNEAQKVSPIDPEELRTIKQGACQEI